MIDAAARRLGVEHAECAVVGDIHSDVEAAAAAGARGVLVPSAPGTVQTQTEPGLDAAAWTGFEVAGDLGEAVDRLLATRVAEPRA
jgi:beta-phosphoglucomutase-like phosphatase (HAD superfamily)